MSRSVLLFAGMALSGGYAFGSNFSFEGKFATDDQLQQFTFTLSSPATVTLRTWSYAGGKNQIGWVIPEGGFHPWLSLYDSSGNLLQSVDNVTCGQVTPDTVSGACFDSFISQSLETGTYTLVLSQSDNQPAGLLLSGGFTRSGQIAFTSSFACSNGSFCDANAGNRSSLWAVDIDNVTSAQSH